MSRSQQTSNSTLETLSNKSGRTTGDGKRRSGGVRIAALALLVLSTTVTSAGTLSAEEPATTQPSMATKLNPMNWKMPTLQMPEFLVPNKDQERIVERKNTLFSDIKTTTSESWQRTKTTFSPARLNPMNLFAGPETQPGQPTKPGFFSSLFSPGEPEPEERVATVNQFLNQDRP